MSRAHVFAAKVKNADDAAKVLRKFTEKFADKLIVKSLGGHTYYAPKLPEPPPEMPDRPQPGFCLLGDYVLFSDRIGAIEKAIQTTDDPTQRLAASLDYKLIAAKARRYAGENGPGLLLFNRPDEDLRFVYGLALNERVRGALTRGGEKNPFLKDLDQALADRPLPPFEVLQQYFAPGAAILIDEPTGLRYLAFVLKRE